MDAAEILGTLASPLAIASTKISRTGMRFPSTNTLPGFKRKPLTARCMANIVACKIFRRSISSTVACATQNASALALIWSYKKFRCLALSFFESAKPGLGSKSSKITAAAKTGPASGPLPASSTPATKVGASQFKGDCLTSKDFFNGMCCDACRVCTQAFVKF